MKDGLSAAEAIANKQYRRGQTRKVLGIIAVVAVIAVVIIGLYAITMRYCLLRTLSRNLTSTPHTASRSLIPMPTTTATVY